jgi:uncharacterized membrane protein YcaP (DUF421 family)
MNFILQIFGQGKDLTALQMGSRGIVVFFIAFLLIRISGRRSFGLKTPLDNIITISLGAVLSRAIVGASAFIPVIFTCFLIVILHRLLGMLIANNKRFGRFIEGEKILVFSEGQFLKENLKSAQLCKEDVMQGIRKSALTEDLSKIEKVYIERNGEISAIKIK